MANIYTDGAGNYYAPGNITVGNPSNQDVNLRCMAFYTTVSLPVSTVESNLGGAWSVAPGLTDIGGGVWVNGVLQDPTH